MSLFSPYSATVCWYLFVQHCTVQMPRGSGRSRVSIPSSPFLPPFISDPLFSLTPYFYFLTSYSSAYELINITSDSTSPPVSVIFFISSSSVCLCFEVVHVLCVPHTELDVYSFHILAYRSLEKRRWIQSGSFCDSGPNRPSPAFALIAFVLVPPKGQSVLCHWPRTPGNQLAAQA